MLPVTPTGIEHGRQDSNLRHSGLEPDALASLSYDRLAEGARVELAAVSPATLFESAWHATCRTFQGSFHGRTLTGR